MSIKSGYEPFIGLGIEQTPGVAVAAKKYIPIVTCTLKGVSDNLLDESAKGIRDKNYGMVNGPQRGEGDIEIYVDVENIMYLLYPALGTIASDTASGESAVYEHVLTRKDSNPPVTVTAIYNDGIDTRKYTYATINTFELNVSDGLATASANILSKMPTAGTGTVALTSERILAFKDYTVKMGSGATGTAALTAAASATETPVKSFKLTINNNAEAHFLSGAASALRIASKGFEVTGEYTVFYEDAKDRDFYETMLYNGDPVKAMIVTFTGDAIGHASHEQIKIEIPNFKIKDRTVDSGIGNFITETLSFVAQYDPDAAKTIKVTVTNTTASY